jgi:hypothetical protein
VRSEIEATSRVPAQISHPISQDSILKMRVLILMAGEHKTTGRVMETLMNQGH